MFDFEYTWQMWENRKGWGPISGSNLDIILYLHMLYVNSSSRSTENSYCNETVILTFAL